MQAKTVIHDSGVVETRFYDNSGRLTEIRKKQPPAKIDRRVGLLKKQYGVKGGHQD